MASKRVDYLKDLKKGKYDWKVHVRILNLWRGVSTREELFKAFNLLLLDAQRNRVNAFVPGAVADEIQKNITVGGIFQINNFTVKDYNMEDKFRPVRKEIQVVFGEDTILKALQENEVHIERYWFDFYDLPDLKPISQQNTFLADVIGVLEEYEGIGKLKNRLGRIQPQFKFHITDGSTSVSVTLWDEFAELLADTLKKELEHPVIIILGCARVTMWRDEVILENVGATTFYLNCNHHSVTQLRKRCSKPGFTKKILSSQKNGTARLYHVKDIKVLDHSHREIEVICQIKIKMISETKSWCHPVCTSCYQKTVTIENVHMCNACTRTVPYAAMSFEVDLTGEDQTGQINIRLEDREVRTLIRKTVYELQNEGHTIAAWPNIMRTLKNKDCTVKLIITEANIEKTQDYYVATDVMEGFNLEACHSAAQESYPNPISESEPQASGSSYHLSNFSTRN